jgi:7-carboxy-7-deazaguanine synthase
MTLTVNETFFSIQGEGTRAGLPCVFVRLTGCPLRCAWCDTAYAFHEGGRREEADLLAEIERHPCRLVLLTGGEPLAQPAAFPFVTLLADRGWTVLVETSGHVPIDGLDPRAVAIVDVKAPGSGETHRMHWENLDRLRPQDEVKFVIADRADYEWSRDLVRERRLAERGPVLFSPVHGALPAGELARWVLADGLAARVQVQLHKYLWPGVERGV